MADYNLGSARGRIEIDASGATEGAEEASEAVDTLGSKVERSSQGLNAIAGIYGGIALAIAGGFAISVKAAADFEQRMAAISAVSGATGAELDSLRDKALQLGADTAFSAGEAALAMEELVKAGLSVDDVLNGAADATVALAAAGEIELPAAAAIGAAALNQFKLEAEDLPAIADLIAGAANASATGVQEIGDALGYVGPVAQAAGLSIQDTAGAIALLANNGIDGQKAGTALRAILTQLSPSTEAATTAFKELGLITEDGANAFYNADGSLKSMNEIIGILNGSMSGLSEQQKITYADAMFGRESLAAVSAMAATTGDEFGALQESIAGVSAADVAGERLNNLNGDLDALKGSLETVAIQVGTYLLPALREIAAVVTNAVNWFSNLSESQQKTIVMVIGITGAILGLIAVVLTIVTTISAFLAVLGPLAAVIGITAGALMGWVAIIPIIIAAVVLLVILIVKNWDTIKAWTISVWESISAFFVALWASITAWFTSVLASISATWTSVWTAVSTFFINIWNSILGFLGGIWNAIMAVVNAYLGILMGIWEAFWDTFGGLITAVWELIVAAVTLYIKLVLFVVMTVFNAIKDFVTTVWNAVWGFISGVWNRIYAFISDKVNAVANFIRAVWGAVSSWISGIWNTVSGAVSTAWNAIYNYISSKVRDAWNFIQNTWSGIAGWVAGIFNGMVNAARGPLDSLVSMVTGIKDRVVGFFSGAASWLVGAGRNIIQGLIDGVTGMINRLTDKLKSITNLIPDVKGPPSVDKKLLKPSGKWIMESLIGGIDSQIPNLVKTLGGISTQIPATVLSANYAPHGLPSAVGAGGGTTINVEWHAAPNDNVETRKQAMNMLGRASAVMVR